MELAKQEAQEQKKVVALQARVQAQLPWLRPSLHLQPQPLGQVPSVHLLVEVVPDGLSTCPT